MGDPCLRKDDGGCFKVVTVDISMTEDGTKQPDSAICLYISQVPNLLINHPFLFSYIYNNFDDFYRHRPITLGVFKLSNLLNVYEGCVFFKNTD